MFDLTFLPILKAALKQQYLHMVHWERLFTALYSPEIDKALASAARLNVHNTRSFVSSDAVPVVVGGALFRIPPGG